MPKFLLSGLVAALATLSPVLPARASTRGVPVAVDCWLTDGPVECQALGASYFQSLGAVAHAPSGGEEPALSIRVRSAALPTGVRYRAEFAGGGTDFGLAEEVRRNVDADAATLRLVTLLQRGTVPFLPLDRPGHSERGAFRLEASGDAPVGAPPASSASDASPFYLRPEVSGELVSQNVELLSLWAEAEANVSLPRWRVLADGGGSLRAIDVDLPDNQHIAGSFWTAYGDLVVARSLDEHASVALVGAANRSPQNNFDGWGSAGLGVEWLGASRLPTTGNNFGVRGRVAAVVEDYVTPNVLGEERAAFARGRLSTFARFHGELVDVTADASVAAPFDQLPLWDVTGSLDTTIRLAGALELGVAGGVTVRGGARHEPADPDQLDAAAVLLSGSDFVRLSTHAELTLSWTFGNALLRTEDQRWR